MFVEVIMAVGETKSAMASAEFHWHKFQWRSNWWIQWVLCNILLNNLISASWRSYENILRLALALHRYASILPIKSAVEQDAQLSQRDRAAGCVIVFAKSRRLELGDNISQTL